MSKTIGDITIKTGGRKPGSLNKRTRQAIEICEAYNFSPVATMIAVITTGKLPNADGTFAEVDTPARLDALKSLMPYIAPRLQATQVTGQNGGPIEVDSTTLDIRAIIASPELAAAAQKLALAMAEQQAALPAPVDPESALLDTSKDALGHYTV